MPGPVLCTEVSTVKPSKRQEVDGSVGNHTVKVEAL